MLLFLNSKYKLTWHNHARSRNRVFRPAAVCRGTSHVRADGTEPCSGTGSSPDRRRNDKVPRKGGRSLDASRCTVECIYTIDFFQLFIDPIARCLDQVFLMSNLILYHMRQCPSNFIPLIRI